MTKESLINLFTAIFEKAGIGLTISFEPVQKHILRKTQASEYVLTVNGKYDLMLTESEHGQYVYMFNQNIDGYIIFDKLSYDDMPKICAEIIRRILLASWHSPGYPCSPKVMEDVLDK